jgi:RHS repeat-associated protein
VRPTHVKLPLDQSVGFSAAQYKEGHPLNVGQVHWTAENVGTHRPARVSPDGVFTARLPGLYKVKARSGRRRGFAIVAVPDGIRHNPNWKPIQCISVSTQTFVQGSSACPAGIPPSLPEPAITGPGWQDSNFRKAFLINNRLGLNVAGSQAFSQLHFRRNLNMDGGTGTGNYVLSVPILSLPGRGQNLSLTLFYNSKLWTKIEDPSNPNKSDMVFDHDQGWPAPGWSLGFGKVVRIGSIGVALEDPDGTLHAFSGVVNPYVDSTNFVSTTSDGTLINCSFWLKNNQFTNGQFASGNASYPNGTIVEYGAPNADGSAIYPTRITDPNGNYIKIGYVNNRGPLLDQVVDTMGRMIQFHYSDGRLISITAPGLGGGWRVPVRLHYQQKQLRYGFDPSITVQSAPSTFWALDAIYFIGTQSGYWFGDQDSYSSYGMIARVSQRRAMGFDISSISSGGQGAITRAGDISHDQSYNYPLGPDPTLTDAPTYTQMAETWAPDRLTAPAVTKFALRTESKMPDPCSSTGNIVTWQRLDTTYPDLTLLVQRTLMDQGYAYGALSQKLTYDPSGKLLQTVTSCYDAGDDQSPRIVKLQITDELNQARTTTFSYQAKDNDHPSPNNQLVDRREIDYDGTTVLRRTHMEYVNGSNYTSFLGLSGDNFARRQILNLPSAITIYQGEAQVLSRTEYTYDTDRGMALFNTVGVINHDDAYNPYAAAYNIPAEDESQCDATDTVSGTKIVCTTVHDPGYTQTDYQKPTDYRGNTAATTRYVSASDKTHPITETMQYDMDGNQVLHRLACCEFTWFGYGRETQYAYPASIRRGAPPDPAKTLTTLFNYDFNTGLVNLNTDPNHLVTQYYYDSDSLRPSQVVLPTSATIKYSYDDEALSVTSAIRDASGGEAGKTITTFDGLQKPTETRTHGPKNTWNAAAAQYDAMGRRYRQSQAYAVGQEPLWNQFTFDSLGRTTNTKAADGNQGFAFYNEATRPSTASILPGQTVRTQDAMGRERWSRTDALGNLAEVVEPNAYSGKGSVNAQGSVQTAYSYNGLGLVTKSIQGPDQQERDFSYDSLGRMTAEYLAEKSRRLDDGGNYIGVNGKWSDVFSYDDRSNLVWHADARGIKTVYDYENDPLDRVQAIGYDMTGFGDTANPVLPAAPVYFSYEPDGDLTRVAQIAIAQSGGNAQSSARSKPAVPTPQSIWALETFTYDSQARIASKTLSYPLQDFRSLAINYEYDSLNRLARLTYPAEFGTPTAERKIVDYAYKFGRLDDLKIDGVEEASQLIYNPADQLTSVNIGPSGNLQTSEIYDYDPATSLMRHEEVLRGNAALLDLRYTYFGNRQVQQVSDGSPGQGINYAYTYDNLGRISSAQASGLGGSLWSQSYKFDTYGNKLSVAASGNTLDGTPIPLDGGAGTPAPVNGLTSFTYDLMTNHNVSVSQIDPFHLGFTYDAAGNQTRVQRADGSWLRYQYDAAGRLARVTDDSGGKTLESYQYGPDRHRFVTTTGSGSTPPKYYVWNGDHVLAEYAQPSKSALVWSKSTSYLGNRVLATFTPSSSNELVQYQHPDRLGTRLITDRSDGTMAQQTLPFGTLIPGVSSDPVDPIFTSYDRSVITALDYAVNRQYDSQQRFTQPDPLEMRATTAGNPQSLNLYSYAGGDPLNGTDPSGLSVQSTLYSDSYDPESPFRYNHRGIDPWMTAIVDGLNLGFMSFLGHDGDDCSDTVSALCEQKSNPTKSLGTSQLQCQLCTEGFQPTTAEPNGGEAIGGEDILRLVALTHGGEFAEGGTVMSLTGFALPFMAAGGIIADVFSTPARPFADIGCLTCKMVEIWVDVEMNEYSLFLEGSLPIRAIDAIYDAYRSWYLGQHSPEEWDEVRSGASGYYQQQNPGFPQ